MIGEVILGILALQVSGITWILFARNRFRQLVRKRYAVTLKAGDGEFAGLLVEKSWESLTFEHCTTVPRQPGDATHEIVGRVHVDRANVAYLQELPNDPV